MKEEKMIQLPLNEVKGLTSLTSILMNSYQFENTETHKQIQNYLVNLNQLIQQKEEN